MTGPHRVTTSLADRFWAADHDLAAACLAHPFVQGLADGSLPAWRYRDYVAQDAFFLRAFAEAYALAARGADDAEGRALYREMTAGIEEELELHRGMAAKLDIDLTTVEPSDATLAYTEFLVATAATRPETCTAAAMLPCLRLYAWLGQELRGVLLESSPWADWVRTYADPGFDALWQRLAPRLERADATLHQELAWLHRRAMRLELAFFASAWGGSAPGQPPIALTIAGSDPSGGAGIQADLKTFHRFGVYGQSVITLLTAQNTRGVQRVHVEPVDVVRAQLASVLDDLMPRAAKTGALGSVEMVTAVAEGLTGVAPVQLVVDPVLVSKHGDALAGEGVSEAVRRLLLPRAAVVTPNRFEAEALTGITVDGRETAERAAAAMRASGSVAVVVKDVPGLAGDLLVGPEGVHVFEGPRLDTPHRHGSGCSFSAALTARLARGDDLYSAVQAARDFTLRAIASAPGFGEVGPLNHWA